MEKISRNPSILLQVLNFIPSGCRLASMLVCKAWSEVALDLLWHEVGVKNFYHFFNILAPLQKCSNEESLYEFERALTMADWTRFGRYNRRVRVIYLSALFVRCRKRLNQRAYDELALSQPPSGITPNVTTLRVNTGYGNLLPLFLTQRVKTLQLDLFYPKNFREAEDPLHNRLDTLHYLSSKLTRLRELTFEVSGYYKLIRTCRELQSSHTIQQEESAICELIRKQRDLRVLSLPSCWFTTRIAEAAASLPHLQKILRNSTDGNPLDTLTFNPALADIFSPFSSLRELSLVLPYPKFLQFILGWIPAEHPNPNLKQLTIQSQVLESSETMQQLLEALVVRCPSLSALGLSSLRTSDQMPCMNHGPYLYGEDLPVRQAQPYWILEDLLPFRVRLNTISPLFTLKSLISCDLHHHLPPVFSLTDLEAIACNFSQIQRLDLFSDPYPIALGIHEGTRHFDEIMRDPTAYETKQIPKLEHILQTFGLHCPKLQELGVFGSPDVGFGTENVKDEDVSDPSITADFDSSTTVSGRPTTKVQYFPALTRLSLGTSPCASDASLTAVVLSEYLSPSTRITTAKAEPWFRDNMVYRGTYAQRLARGGWVSYPPQSITQNDIDGIRIEAPSLPEYQPWKFFQHGKPFHDLQALLFDGTGERLVFDPKMFLDDPVMCGTLARAGKVSDSRRWMPGVSLVEGQDIVIYTELVRRAKGWKEVHELWPLMCKIKEQEMQLAGAMTLMDL
ncbi:hypothetical protein BDN72DRAFT_961865 [Pluteus cervinus]|uniref:Uncharacterized protein n=1 Tax=Pluteus cervinus TaxID=181527 RepID=A0ACD3ALU6_9AGAR|nr:hypothetical protein BDN72DRAFT_961865 [Pluteus cervinus]